MKAVPFIFALCALFAACNNQPQPSQPWIVGTWELIAATSTAQDSTVSTFDPKTRMIKIINPTHFAFLSHSIDKTSDSAANAFSAGGGTYTLADSIYTEHLDFFGDKKWENLSFSFVVKLTGDTLVQKGVEKNEKIGVDHIIVETYKRVKN